MFLAPWSESYPSVKEGIVYLPIRDLSIKDLRVDPEPRLDVVLDPFELQQYLHAVDVENGDFIDKMLYHAYYGGYSNLYSLVCRYPNGLYFLSDPKLKLEKVDYRNPWTVILGYYLLHRLLKIKDPTDEECEQLSSLLDKGVIPSPITSSDADPKFYSIITNQISKNRKLRDYMYYNSEKLNVNEIKGLLDSGSDINSTDITGHDTLKSAILAEDIDVVRFILTETDINVNIRNYQMCTSLHIALRNGVKDEIIEELLRHPDIDIDALDIWGKTAGSYKTRTLSGTLCSIV